MKRKAMNVNPLLVLLPVFGSLILPSCGGEDHSSGQEAAQAEYRTAAQRLQHPEEVVAIGKVIPEQEVLEMSFETTGQVHRILVPEGEAADDGDALITLDTDLEQNNLESLEAELALNQLEQREAREEVAYQKKVLGQQEQTYRRLKQSVEADALPASRLDQVELDLLNTRQQIDQQQRQVERLALQERQLRIRRGEVRLRIGKKTIRAPGAGQVIRWDVREGAGVQAFEVVGAFAPDGPRLVEAEVDEYFAGSVEVGQPAIIKRQGFPDTLARGEVVFTSPDLSDKSILSQNNTQFEDLQVRRIKIQLDDGQELLLGQEVEAIIQIPENQ